VAAQPFPADALADNRAGRLSGEQQRWLRSLARNWRSSGRSIAVIAAVLGFIVLFLADKGGTTRVLLGVGLLVFAGLIFVLSIVGADSMDADLRAGKVLSVEGAIAKRTVVMHGRSTSSTTYYIDVDDKSMQAFRDQYEAAPDAGYVRVYYVPRSMRVVNLEELPDKPVPDGAIKSPADVLKLAASGLVGFDEVKKAEARAEMAAISRQVGPQPANPPPASRRDPRPLAEAIVGAWSNGVLTLTFNPDGTVKAVTAIGAQPRDGRWSVDAQGRLVGDVMGEHAAVEAWVAGDRLTIAQAGEAMSFQRA
jgi:hypothetical protein